MAVNRKRKTETPYREIKVGKGLDALFGESTDSSFSEQSVPISDIHFPPQQPRRYFDPQAMQALTNSVRRDGILEPLLVRQRASGGYELVAGERRYRAAKEVGLVDLPVIIRQLTDGQALHITLVENLLREDLNPLEETEGILNLLSLRLGTDVESVISLLYRMQNDVQRVTHNVMGQAEAEVIQTVFVEVGLAWESFVNNRLPLLKLPEDILAALRSGQIAYTKAQAIARVKDEQHRKSLLEQAVMKGLSLTEIRAVAKEIKRSEQSGNKDEPHFRVRIDNVCRRMKKSKLWDDPKKRLNLEKALAAVEALLNTES